MTQSECDDFCMTHLVASDEVELHLSVIRALSSGSGSKLERRSNPRGLKVFATRATEREKFRDVRLDCWRVRQL